MFRIKVRVQADFVYCTAYIRLLYLLLCPLFGSHIFHRLYSKNPVKLIINKNICFNPQEPGPFAF